MKPRKPSAAQIRKWRVEFDLPAGSGRDYAPDAAVIAIARRIEKVQQAAAAISRLRRRSV